jgi:hypothetical protein
VGVARVEARLGFRSDTGQLAEQLLSTHTLSVCVDVHWPLMQVVEDDVVIEDKPPLAASLTPMVPMVPSDHRTIIPTTCVGAESCTWSVEQRTETCASAH